MCDIFKYRGDDCHIGYKNIFQKDLASQDKHVSYIRERVKEMWVKFSSYADTQFKTDFRKQPDQRYWEMYLGCCLVEQGFNISSSDMGPDFALDVDGAKVWIEAVTASAGDESSPDKIPELIPISEGGGAQSVPREKLILRYTTVLDCKIKKYREYVDKGLVAKDDIKVIAVSRGELRRWPEGDRLPYIMSALFSMGHEYITFDKNSSEVIGGGRHYQESVSKENGSSIETKFFTDPAYSDISAIIYSSTDLGNPPRENGMDIIVIHNPLAEIPLSKNTFKFADEYWLEESNGSWHIKNKANQSI